MKFTIIFTLFLVSISQASYAQESVMDSVNDNSPEVTEQQNAQANRYIHEGIATQQVREACEEGRGGFKDICTERQFAFSDGGMRTLETLLPVLTKAYAMFSTMGPGGKFTKTEMLKGKEQTSEETDYCGYIAMVSEGASTAFTLLNNNRTQRNYTSAKPEAKQAASFYALADSQKTMAKAANIQFYSWTATAACYVGYISQAAFRGDWKVGAKLAGSSLIAMYYKKKAEAHKKRRGLLLKMASELPQAGDCNPFTNKSCFCAEETSKQSDPGNYQAICLPSALAKRSGAGQDAFVCATANGKADVDCDCIKSSSCADTRLKIAGVKLGLGPTIMRDPLAALRPIAKGFSGASARAAANRNLALAKRTLKSLKLKKKPKLNSNQLKLAKRLYKAGLPSSAAALLAGSKTSGGKLPSSATSGFGGAGFGKGSKGKYAISGYTGKRVTGKTASTRRKRGSSYGRYGRKKSRKNRPSIQIEDFQKKAMREAEIVQDTSKGIFDIISNRYKISAWRQYRDNLK